jgi:hypothetical protein
MRESPLSSFDVNTVDQTLSVSPTINENNTQLQNQSQNYFKKKDDKCHPFFNLNISSLLCCMNSKVLFYNLVKFSRFFNLRPMTTLAKNMRIRIWYGIQNIPTT